MLTGSQQNNDRGRRESQYSTLVMAPDYFGNSIFLFLPVLSLNVCPCFLAHTNAQMLLVPSVHLFSYLAKNNYFGSHFPLTIASLTSLGFTITFQGLCTWLRYISWQCCSPCLIQKKFLNFPFSLSFSLACFLPLVQYIQCNLLSFLTVDTSKKYDFYF